MGHRLHSQTSREHDQVLFFVFHFTFCEFIGFGWMVLVDFKNVTHVNLET